jgi:hypothetical protein
MRKINYSEFDLEGFSVKELQRICRYYGLEYSENWKEKKLIKEILAYSPVELIEKTYNMAKIYEVMNPIYPVIVRTEPTKSVRVSRIEENIRKGK